MIWRGNADAWLALARRVTADALAREVRRVDRDAIEGVPLDDRSWRRPLDIRCTARVHAKWREAQSLCRRMAGSTTGSGLTAEWVAAEVFSGLPHTEAAGLWAGERCGLERCAGDPASRAEPAAPEPPPPAEPASFDLAPFLDGLDDADAFALDARLRELLEREQRLEAEIGPLLAVIWRSGVSRKLGYATLDAYAL